MQDATGKLSIRACAPTRRRGCPGCISTTAALNGGETTTSKGQLAFSGLIQVKHIALLATWYKSTYFKLRPARRGGSPLRRRRTCGMLTSSSALAASLRKGSPISTSVSPRCPTTTTPMALRNTTLADGASLWIGEGRKPAEYKAAAAFVNSCWRPRSRSRSARSAATCR